MFLVIGLLLLQMCGMHGQDPMDFAKTPSSSAYFDPLWWILGIDRCDLAARQHTLHIQTYVYYSAASDTESLHIVLREPVRSPRVLHLEAHQLDLRIQKQVLFRFDPLESHAHV